jgi:hypothetical protein
MTFPLFRWIKSSDREEQGVACVNRQLPSKPGTSFRIPEEKTLIIGRGYDRYRVGLLAGQEIHAEPLDFQRSPAANSTDLVDTIDEKSLKQSGIL